MADAAAGAGPVQPKSESQVINLVVKDQSGHEVHFKVKTVTLLSKVLRSVCRVRWSRAGGAARRRLGV
jgi:hypothetical protein